MKKNSQPKGLFLQWLENALNEQWYRGLYWKDKQNKIFCIQWTHKAAEQWSEKDLEPFEAWAIYKGKRNGKNEKQLKATFRCALNSKTKELRELRELSKNNRNLRIWQFVDPNSVDNITPKRKCKAKKIPLKEAVTSTATYTSVEDIKLNDLPLTLKSNNERSTTRLPAFGSFYNFEPLTPPHQVNENSYSFTEAKNCEKETNRKKRSKELSECATTTAITFKNVSNIFTGNVSTGNSYEAENSTAALLPPFETFCSFRLLTPPPQKNEVFITSTEYRTNYTPPPDHSRLTPPQKNYHNISRDSLYHSSSTEVWQPNCWSLPRSEEDLSNLNQFFSSDFIGMYKSASRELEVDSRPMDFVEMDQYVPVMDFDPRHQIPNRNEHHNLTNKTSSCADDERPDQFQRLLMDDDYLLSDDVDQEACERIMQELDRPSPTL